MTTATSIRHLFAVAALSLGLAPAAAGDATDNRQQAEHCAAQLGSLPVARGQALPGRLRVLSWNIRKTFDAGWRDDLLRLGSDADLAFLQEASLSAGLGEVWPGGPLYQAFAEGYVDTRINTGVMTLSTRAPAMQCNFTRLEPWLGTPKAAAVTEHAIAGRDERLLAINIHAVNFTLGVEDLRAQLAPLATLLERHPGPVILAGDFNTWSAARARLVDHMLRDRGLAPLAFDPDLRSRAFGRALDHIYVRGLVAEHTEVVPVSSSDHNPLRASLRLVM